MLVKIEKSVNDCKSRIVHLDIEAALIKTQQAFRRP